MMIMDEKLLNAVSESFLCGYEPTHSRRFYAYLHHRDRVPERGYSYNNESYCNESCDYCSKKQTNIANNVIVKSLRALKNCFHDREPDGDQNDLVAGDFHVFGWVIV